MMKNLESEMEKSDSQGGQYFKLKVDNDENGQAILRFLPQKDLSEVPYVEKFSHYFKDDITGEVYNELSATTFGEKDVIGKFNSWLWGKGLEDRARKQARKRSYYSNVYVVRSEVKEQEGQVLIYQFGQKIFAKIKSAMFPTSEFDEPINPFDVFEGANFRLKASKVSGYRNYDNSVFEQNTGPLLGDDDKIDGVLEQCHDLTSMVSKSMIKTEEEQLKILDKVFGRDPLWVKFKAEAGFEAVVSNSKPTKEVETQVDDDVPFDGGVPVKATKPEKKEKASSSIDSDIDDILNSL